MFGTLHFSEGRLVDRTWVRVADLVAEKKLAINACFVKLTTVRRLSKNIVRVSVNLRNYQRFASDWYYFTLLKVWLAHHIRI